VVVSRYTEAVVRLDVDGVDVAALAAELTDFLVARKIIAANLERDGLWRPHAWVPGPDWLSVLEPHPEVRRHLAGNGVDVMTELRTVMGGRTQIVRSRY
jgi:hypothetical protein